MKEPISEGLAVELAKRFGIEETALFGTGDLQSLCNAAIQWDREQQAKGLPTTPTPVAQFNWGSGVFEWLQPYEYATHHRQPLVRQVDAQVYAQQCASAALAAAEARALAAAKQMGIYRHHATRVLVTAIRGWPCQR